MKNAKFELLILMDDQGCIALPVELISGSDGVQIQPFVIAAYALIAKNGVIRIPLEEIGEIKTADLNESAFIRQELDGYRPFFASTSVEVAEFLLTKDSIDHRKLNYLIYLAFVEYLMAENSSSDRIQKQLFSRQIKVHSAGLDCLRMLRVPLDSAGRYRQLRPEQINDQIDPTVVTILNRVWQRYHNYSAEQLAKLISQTSAMQLAWSNLKQSDVDSMDPAAIYQCYQDDNGKD
ncbi:hypothetical protein MOO44_03790 [Nicoliella spurrieriana]|uniref:Uncharacterized protein n=1 Tax=Nicoliella spurrieriana TaxID=2925830 RepID=A0A976RT87_9LACO|nr:hypothetical protein [Nicoliella spurrieriana]UQS87289.1 hypothetical protein MOO44_03790 [Nicoliella spurrieriana]